MPSISAPRTFQGDSAVVTWGHLNELAEIEWSSDKGEIGSVQHHLDPHRDHGSSGACHVAWRHISCGVSSRAEGRPPVDIGPQDSQLANAAGGSQALIDGLKGGSDFKPVSGRASGAALCGDRGFGPSERIGNINSMHFKTSNPGFGVQNKWCSPHQRR